MNFYCSVVQMLPIQQLWGNFSISILNQVLPWLFEMLVSYVLYLYTAQGNRSPVLQKQFLPFAVS